MSAVDALVITCMDARLHRADRPYLVDYLRGKHGGIQVWDLVTVPGGCKGLVDADLPHIRETLVRSVAIARDAHGVRKVFLVNHSDCAAYGGSSASANAADEYRRHADDLRAARTVLREVSPNLDIRLFYASVENRPDGPFVTVDEVR